MIASESCSGVRIMATNYGEKHRLLRFFHQELDGAPAPDDQSENYSPGPTLLAGNGVDALYSPHTMSYDVFIMFHYRKDAERYFDLSDMKNVSILKQGVFDCGDRAKEKSSTV